MCGWDRKRSMLCCLRVISLLLKQKRVFDSVNTTNVIFVSDLHLIGIWAIRHIERIDLFDKSTSICLYVVSARANGRVPAALWTRLAVLMRLHSVWGETQRCRWRWWREGGWRAGILLLIRSSICDGGDPEPKRIQVGPISHATANTNRARWLLPYGGSNEPDSL